MAHASLASYEVSGRTLIPLQGGQIREGDLLLVENDATYYLDREANFKLPQAFTPKGLKIIAQGKRSAAL
jgi:hypothetical protein